MMHWHGYRRDEITIEAERERIKTGQVDCYPKALCIKSDEMANWQARVAARRAAMSYYNAANEGRRRKRR